MSSFDRVAEIYDATRSLPPPAMESIIDGIEAFVGSSSVVDIGVGTGRFAAPLTERGVDVVGFDISLPMLRQARAKGVPGLVIAAAEFAPFRQQTFDYAMVVHFMHLLKDWRSAVGEISRVARRGLIAVVGDSEGSHPRDLYVRLRESRGFKMAGLRMGEREMVGMVEPAVTRRLVSYREEFDPSALLDEYSAKLHSITWDIPDDVNSQIVAEMRLLLGEKREVERSATLVVWERDQMRGLHPSP